LLRNSFNVRERTEGRMREMKIDAEHPAMGRKLNIVGELIEMRKG